MRAWRRLPSSDNAPRAASTRRRTSSAALCSAVSAPSSAGKVLTARSRRDRQAGTVPHHLLEPGQLIGLLTGLDSRISLSARQSRAHRCCVQAGGCRSAPAAPHLPSGRSSNLCSSSARSSPGRLLARSCSIVTGHLGRLCAKADQGLQQRRAVGGQEHLLRHGANAEFARSSGRTLSTRTSSAPSPAADCPRPPAAARHGPTRPKPSPAA